MSSLELLIVLALGWHATFVHPSPEVRRTSQLPELFNLHVYNNTLYVGGLDRLYSFDEDLNVLQSADTCTGPCKSNYNKVLLLNETGQTLMTCGTGNGGICERRLLSNLSSVVHSSSYGDNTYIDTLVVSTERNRPAVALMWGTHLFLMVVSYGANVPVVEVQRYDIDYAYTALALRTDQFSINEGISFRSNMRFQIYRNMLNYIVYYKGAFKYETYTFLLTNQKTNVGNDTFVSKIARLCNFDLAFTTYVDMELSCESDGAKYNLAQDAKVVKLNGTDYLIASFAKNNNPERVAGAGIICTKSFSDLNADLTRAEVQYVNEYPFKQEERYFETRPSGGFVSRQLFVFNFLLYTFNNSLECRS